MSVMRLKRWDSSINVLGIETSCDETAAAIYNPERGLLANTIYSQVALHAPYGGVVPELASRDHLQHIVPVVSEALHTAGCTPAAIDLIAYTRGPGLVGALMVGASFAQGLAYALECPVVGVHHIEAHLLAVQLGETAPSYPYLGLLVSGGHTMLVQVEAFGRYRILGETLDDAVGEAFDKTAMLLGLGYPGGPALAKLAEQGDPNRFTFSRPMINRPGLSMSFSGLKTQVARAIAAAESDEQTRADIAAAFEVTVVDTLLIKVARAVAETGINQVVVAGGVSANQHLRAECARRFDFPVLFPSPALCTDNAAMVAYTGAQRYARGEQAGDAMAVRARWPIDAIDEAD